MLKVPEAVGVPLMAPVLVLSVRPAGSVPTTEKVYGGVPPVTVSGPLLNGTPTVPVVPDDRQVSIGGETIVYGQVVLDMTPLASVTLILNVPAAVGVPVIAPVLVFSVRPAGSVPTTEKVYGAVPPVTVSAPLLNGTPTSPVVPVARQVNNGVGTIMMLQFSPVVVAITPLESFTCAV